MAGSGRRLLLHACGKRLSVRRVAWLVLRAAAGRRRDDDRPRSDRSAAARGSDPRGRSFQRPRPSHRMIILGLNAFHGDSSAALVCDGALVAAVEEERFRRVKHWAGFPAQSIAYCLREAGVRLGGVEHIPVNQDGRAHRMRRIAYLAAHPPRLGLIRDRIRNRHHRKRIPELLEAAFPGERFRGQFHPVEHHFAHLSSAFHVSPFDEAVVVSVDGLGDFASAAWGVGRGSEISVEGRVHFPHSLGIFYQALTQYLGFPDYGDEYKVMGLAPYGSPAVRHATREIVQLTDDGGFALDLDYFRHHRERIAFSWASGAPEFADLFSPVL